MSFWLNAPSVLRGRLNLWMLASRWLALLKAWHLMLSWHGIYVEGVPAISTETHTLLSHHESLCFQPPPSSMRRSAYLSFWEWNKNWTAARAIQVVGCKIPSYSSSTTSRNRSSQPGSIQHQHSTPTSYLRRFASSSECYCIRGDIKFTQGHTKDDDGCLAGVGDTL